MFEQRLDTVKKRKDVYFVYLLEDEEEKIDL